MGPKSGSNRAHLGSTSGSCMDLFGNLSDFERFTERRLGDGIGTPG